MTDPKQVEEAAALKAVRTEDTQALEKILYRSLPEWNRCCKDDEFCPYDGHCSTGQARAVIDAGWRPREALDLIAQVLGDALQEERAKVARVEALVNAWDEPTWSGHLTATPFIRAVRTALTPGTPEERLRAALAEPTEPQ